MLPENSAMQRPPAITQGQVVPPTAPTSGAACQAAAGAQCLVPPDARCAVNALGPREVALNRAISHLTLSEIRSLLPSVDVTAADEAGRTCLHHVALAGVQAHRVPHAARLHRAIEAARMLTKAGARPTWDTAKVRPAVYVLGRRARHAGQPRQGARASVCSQAGPSLSSNAQGLENLLNELVKALNCGTLLLVDRLQDLPSELKSMVLTQLTWKELDRFVHSFEPAAGVVDQQYVDAIHWCGKISRAGTVDKLMWSLSSATRLPAHMHPIVQDAFLTWLTEVSLNTFAFIVTEVHALMVECKAPASWEALLRNAVHNELKHISDMSPANDFLRRNVHAVICLDGMAGKLKIDDVELARPNGLIHQMWAVCAEVSMETLIATQQFADETIMRHAEWLRRHFMTWQVPAAFREFELFEDLLAPEAERSFPEAARREFALAYVTAVRAQCPQGAQRSFRGMTTVREWVRRWLDEEQLSMPLARDFVRCIREFFADDHAALMVADEIGQWVREKAWYSITMLALRTHSLGLELPGESSSAAQAVGHQSTIVPSTTESLVEALPDAYLAGVFLEAMQLYNNHTNLQAPERMTLVSGYLHVARRLIEQTAPDAVLRKQIQAVFKRFSPEMNARPDLPPAVARDLAVVRAWVDANRANVCLPAVPSS